MISSLTGKLFSWEDARSQLSTLEAASLRERALLIVRELEALVPQIAAAVAAGDSRSWVRHEKEGTRALEFLRETDSRFRGGASGVLYATLVDLSFGTLGDLIAEAGSCLQTASSCLHCDPSTTSNFEDLVRTLMDRATAFELRIRTKP